jgi:hypothetical protein
MKIHFSEFREEFSREIGPYSGSAICGMPAGRMYRNRPMDNRPGWVQRELLPRAQRIESGSDVLVTDNPRRVTCQLCRRNWQFRAAFHPSYQTDWEQRWRYVNETLPTQYEQRRAAEQRLVATVSGPLRQFLDRHWPSWQLLAGIDSEQFKLVKAAFAAGMAAAKSKAK